MKDIITTSAPHTPITKRSITPPHYRRDPETRVKPINWNRADDSKDHEVWNRLTSSF